MVVVFDAWKAIRARARAAVARRGRDRAAAGRRGDRSRRRGTSTATSTSILDQIEEYFLYHGARTAGRRSRTSCREPDAGPGCAANLLLALREDALAQLDVLQGAQIPACSRTSCGSTTSTATRRAQAIVGPVDALNELAPDDGASSSSRARRSRARPGRRGRLDVGRRRPRRGRGGRRRADRGAVPPARDGAALGRRASAGVGVAPRSRR